MQVNATATLPKFLLLSLSIAEITKCFSYHDVELKGVKFGEEFVTLKIHGTKSSIRTAVKDLYNSINRQYRRSETTDSKAANKVPDTLKSYLMTMEDSIGYKQHYERYADQYMKYCALNDIDPHPEVIEDFVY